MTGPAKRAARFPRAILWTARIWGVLVCVIMLLLALGFPSVLFVAYGLFARRQAHPAASD